jgi:ABC-type sugar transport system permease subunit
MALRERRRDVKPRIQAETTLPSRWRGRWEGRVAPYFYVLPALTFFTLFLAFPVGFAFWLSLHSWDGLTSLSQAPYVGFSNFTEAFHDPIFWQSFRDTVLFTVATTAFQMAVAFLLAFTLWFFKLRFASLLRAIYFFPAVLSMVFVGLLWRQLLTGGGAIDTLAGHIGLHVQWLADPSVVMWVVIWVTNWQWTGWSMILFLAGMVGIPNDIVEAAKIDGASSFRVLRTIAVPLLRPVTALVMLLNVIGGFQVFDTIYVMTGGGPAHASEVLGTYAYWLGFAQFGPGELGYAATIAVLMVAVLFVFSYMRIRMARLV